MGPEEVKRIAALARLEISEADVTEYARNLSEILRFVEQIDAVDTDGVTPMAHPQNEAQRLREDAVTEPDRRDDFQKIAPQTEAGLYLVPKVIE